MLYPIDGSNDALVAYGRGPQGIAGEVSQAELDAAVAALKGSATAAADTLGEIEALLALKPNLAGPNTYTGTHNFPTQANGNSSTKAATTAFVQQELTNYAQPLDALLTGISSLSASMSGFVLFTGGIASVVTLNTSTSLSGASNTDVATSAAVKAYADALIAANDAMIFKGVIDCSANPNYPAADRGHTYKVSVAGKIGGASGTNVEAGDTLLCLTDGTASGTQAAVGAQWNVVQANLDGAVIGPASSTDGNLALFNGTTGKVIKDGGVVSAFALTFLDDASAAAVRTTLGLVAVAASGSASDLATGTLAAARMPAFGGGDVSFMTGGGVGTIANDAVTYAKMQNVSGTDKVLGRSTAGAGDVEEITLTAAGRALIDDVDASAQRATLGLGHGHQEFTASGTFTTPAETNATSLFKFTITGGGGGGGSATGVPSASGGGGAGGTCILHISGLAASTGYTVTVGAAGAAGSAGGDGGAGGASSVVIGATTYTGSGGGAGTGTTGANQATPGGSGATATNGSINNQGGDGSGGLYNTAQTSGRGGDGGASYWGGGGKGAYGGGLAGSDGKAYGSGGGGSCIHTTGGAGKAGIVAVEWKL